MKELLTYILERLVDHPEDMSVREEVADSKTILIIHVHPEDMGKVIGKSGRIIKAIRDLIKVAATKQNVFVDVVLEEDATG